VPVATPPAYKVLYQNDANWTRAAKPSTRQNSYLLYPTDIIGTQINNTCASIGETPAYVYNDMDPGLVLQLQYLISDGSYNDGQTFWVQAKTQNGSAYCTSLEVHSGSVVFATHLCARAYPLICTNSAPRSTAKKATLNSTYAIEVNGLTAYRDAFSFRFIQQPYANTPTRFTASTVYVPEAGKTVPGQSPQCPQLGGLNSTYWEDCLVANVYTSVIASQAHNITLRPIMMFIHGGGSTTGSGLDPTFDGGSLASRGDVVVVTPNYRLGNLGFLSIDNDYSGNWALSDLISCLKWIQMNAASFGGDPNRVTVFGQSAGAQLTSTLLSSPSAAGLFHRAILISGKPADLGNEHQTAADAQAGPGAATLSSLGCVNDTTVIDCLDGLSTSAFLYGNISNKGVVDGNLVVQPNVDVAQLRDGYVNDVPVIMGYMRDEMAALGDPPPLSITDLNTALKYAGINSANRTAVLNRPDLFPLDNTTIGIQNLTVTVETDCQSIKRCGQDATMYSAASTGVFNGLWGYTQDQRAYQIKGYDPYDICTSTTNATTGYYFCHSGDLLPIFNTHGYTASYPIRDDDDVVHTALMMDYWTTFARKGDPNPSQSYLAVRNYTTTADRTQGNAWSSITNNSQQLLSIGPNPVMKDLQFRSPQCSALGWPIDYINQGR
jgi:carboxylesterase type B